MLIQFTEEQVLLQETAREFAVNECRPRAVEIDKTGEFPHDLWKRCAELGFLGLSIPEEFGGAGVGAVEEQIVMEELSRELPVLALAYDANLLTMRTLLYGEREELKQKYLPGMVAGDLIAGYGITEACGSSNFLQWTPTGVKEGNEWVINCTKHFVTCSHIADFYCIMGLFDGALGYVYIDKGTPGLVTGKLEHKLGMNGSYTGTVEMNNIRLPETQFCRNGAGLGTSLCYINISTMTLGIMETCYEKTREYMLQRTRFNVPLASFQVVAHNLAKMATQIEFAKTMIYAVAQAADAGKPIDLYAHMVKAMVPTWGCDMVTKCIEMHGGIGYSEEAGLARLLRDSVCNLIGEFPTDIHWDQVALWTDLPIQTAVKA